MTGYKQRIWKKDPAFSLIPWVLMWIFLAVFVLSMLFRENATISAKYVVQDALASAALAAEVIDLDILSEQQEYIITDIAQAKALFTESLAASLSLSLEGYPQQTFYLSDAVPVEITQLSIYNVSRGQTYETDLLTNGSQLNYDKTTGLSLERACTNRGSGYQIEMLDGRRKAITDTALYAKIRFGVETVQHNTVILEKDILTDIRGTTGNEMETESEPESEPE